MCVRVWVQHASVQVIYTVCAWPSMHACVHVHACMHACVCVHAHIASLYWLKLLWGSLVICLLHALPGYSFSWHTCICIQTETKDHVCPFCWWQLRRNCMYNSKNIRWVSFWPASADGPNADWEMKNGKTHHAAGLCYWFIFLCLLLLPGDSSCTEIVFYGQLSPLMHVPRSQFFCSNDYGYIWMHKSTFVSW